jgi:hypothetical protein
LLRTLASKKNCSIKVLINKIGKNAKIESSYMNKQLTEFIDTSKIRAIKKKFLIGKNNPDLIAIQSLLEIT